MNAHDVVLVGSLAELPPLLAVLQEHLDDYDELLPHVFIADVTRWIAERYADDSDDPVAISALNLLESAFASGRADDRELIAASFLENLPSETEARPLHDALGPALRGYLSGLG